MIDFRRGARARDRIRDRKSRVRDARASAFKVFKILGSGYIRCKKLYLVYMYIYVHAEKKQAYTLTHRTRYTCTRHSRDARTRMYVPLLYHGVG